MLNKLVRGDAEPSTLKVGFKLIIFSKSRERAIRTLDDPFFLCRKTCMNQPYRSAAEVLRSSSSFLIHESTKHSIMEIEKHCALSHRSSWYPCKHVSPKCSTNSKISLREKRSDCWKRRGRKLRVDKTSTSSKAFKDFTSDDWVKSSASDVSLPERKIFNRIDRHLWKVFESGNALTLCRVFCRITSMVSGSSKKTSFWVGSLIFSLKTRGEAKSNKALEIGIASFRIIGADATTGDRMLKHACIRSSLDAI